MENDREGVAATKNPEKNALARNLETNDENIEKVTKMASILRLRTRMMITTTIKNGTIRMVMYDEHDPNLVCVAEELAARQEALIKEQRLTTKMKRTM
uniref:Uncharacterized protein n=1 Tax=Cannabis sativa TaxID=3483 RepID=A0A803QNS1_CANSA